MKNDSKGSSPGKTHTIRLYEKQIKVNVQYSSPPKQKQLINEEPQSIEEQIVIQTMNFMTNNHLRMKNLKKKIDVKPADVKGGFYKYHIKSCNNLAIQYEQFHQKLLDGVAQRRINVYSNSKTQSRYQTPLKNIIIPTKFISLKACKATATAVNSDTKRLKQVQNEQKVKKNDSQVPRKAIKLGKIRLFSNSKDNKQKQNLSSNTKRKNKIHVVSSNRKKKNDSLDSGPGQFSQELRCGRMNTSTQRLSYAAVNSFNISVFH